MSYVAERLREPSTYIGLALTLGLAIAPLLPPPWGMLLQALAGAFGVGAAALPDRPVPIVLRPSRAPSPAPQAAPEPPAAEPPPKARPADVEASLALLANILRSRSQYKVDPRGDGP